ncbi:MAG TPA: DUF4249 domain-containing protein [Bacteroidales bacterium]|nr:DUF4249 domain-containing protein [Bacteroidales bacterium]
MKRLKILPVIILILLSGGCVTEFIPEITDEKQVLVIEGMITDQPVANKVKISLSLPISDLTNPLPVTGATVSVKDDLGNSYSLNEKEPGCYYTDPRNFRGLPGRKYALFVEAYTGIYASSFMEMTAVPPIDSIYYEKEFVKMNQLGEVVEGCRIFLDTHDPSNLTRFFRWDYSETWMIRLPYMVPNNICWITLESNHILLNSTSYLAESKVKHMPVKKISTETDDRLKELYSILVTQYSLNEEEFHYWEKIRKISDKTGGLYDVIPMNVEGNIKNIIDPEEQVLGFFSVSSVASQRLFIKDYFAGFKNLYSSCPYATVPMKSPIRYLGTLYWIIIWDYDANTKTYTDQLRCADCTTRGTTERPDFWPDDY